MPTARGEAGSTAPRILGVIRHAYSASVHGGRSRPLCGASRSSRRHERNQEPRWFRRLFPPDRHRRIPEEWSQVACDVLAQKYFRKAGVPTRLRPVPEEERAGIPVAQARRWYRDARRAFGQGSVRPAGGHLGLLGLERAAISMARPMRAPSMTRCASCWRRRRCGAQLAAIAFNTEAALGVWHRRTEARVISMSITRPALRLTKSASSYEHPQPHACFIQGVKDDLVNEGGIMDLWTREARLFKYGSGTGTNFSALRGEEREAVRAVASRRAPDELPPRSATARRARSKSGGTTRRAAKMVIARRCRSSRHRASSSTGR